MSISTNDLKNGMALNLPEGLMTVIEFQHVKPGKGGAFVRTKLRNYRTGAVFERTYRADEKLTLAIIDKKEMQYLYRDGDGYTFMDNESYEQIGVDRGRPRRRHQVPEGGRHRHPPDVPGAGRRRRAPGVGRARGHPDRPRRTGRPGLGGQEAGHAGDRSGRPGPAVRRDG